MLDHFSGYKEGYKNTDNTNLCLVQPLNTAVKVVNEYSNIVPLLQKNKKPELVLEYDSEKIYTSEIAQTAVEYLLFNKKYKGVLLLDNQDLLYEIYLSLLSFITTYNKFLGNRIKQISYDIINYQNMNISPDNKWFLISRSNLDLVFPFALDYVVTDVPELVYSIQSKKKLILSGCNGCVSCYIINASGVVKPDENDKCSQNCTGCFVLETD